MAGPIEARSFNRAQARQWLLDQITLHADDVVQVTRNEPRDLTDIAIWLADTTGQITYPVVGRGLPRHDTFTTLVVCSVLVPGDEPHEAEERVEQLAAGVLDAVSEDPHAPLDITGLIDVSVTSCDGPDLVPAVEGFAALMTVAVQFDMRISR